ncbi:hypothetical protein SAE02_40530 [Skermanella aerolata]|uniref:Uncharacterized protein n=1 Tax=Skermanella aerolata TaxID=393310 RepID=A0A512DTW4_9PROT|nr:hypothetical protein SAE02_40530 [Skermanella aerolata]
MAPTPIEPSAPAFATAAAMAGDDTPAIGAWTIGSSMPSNVSSACGEAEDGMPALPWVLVETIIAADWP